MSVIGIMEGAFFVSKRELLEWINDLLGLSYTKVEQACTGAAYCQILDALYPGKVPLSRVKFNANHDFEYIANFKIVQSIFARCGIEKVIEVDRIVKGKPLDNLEFMQWMKRFFDLHYAGGEYHAVERRRQAGIKDSDVPFNVPDAPPYIGENKMVNTVVIPGTPIHKDKVKRVVPDSATKPTPVKVPKRATPAQKTSKPIKEKPVVSSTKSSKNEEELNYLKYTVDGLERERDFYFGKLRQVEILCQGYQSEPSTIPAGEELVQKVLDILYANDSQ